MLTFDKIRDMERTERASKKLQRLPEDIVAQMRDYMRRKEKLEKTGADIIEAENINTTIKRLFELRESKVLSAVADAVRTGLPPENMTKDEEAAFHGMADILRRHREKLFRELRSEPKTESYKVKKAVPPFLGPDMKTYELRENEIVTIPSPLDELLIREGIIERV